MAPELTPTVHTWTAPMARRQVFLCAGTAGGVGTTTVAALLASLIAGRTGRPCRALDHTGGALAARVSANSATAPHVIHDLGVHSQSIPPLLGSGDVIPVICLRPNSDLDADPLDPHLPHAVVVNSSCRRVSAAQWAQKLPLELPYVVVISLEWDPGLAAPGPISLAGLTHRTITEATRLLSFLHPYPQPAEEVVRPYLDEQQIGNIAGEAGFPGAQAGHSGDSAQLAQSGDGAVVTQKEELFFG